MANKEQWTCVICNVAVFRGDRDRAERQMNRCPKCHQPFCDSLREHAVNYIEAQREKVK